MNVTHTSTSTRAGPFAAALLLTSVLLVGCGSETAEPHDHSPAVTADDDAPPTPPLSESKRDFQRIVATFDAKGAEGAQAAWDDGDAVFLVFAASW